MHSSSFKSTAAAEVKLQTLNLTTEFLQLLLNILVLLGHFFVLGLPLIAVILQCLHFAFEMAGLDICLA